MTNYELELNEVILFEDTVSHSNFKGDLELTLTSSKIIFEKEKGLFNKTKELIDIINLKDIKIYNDKPQVSQKGIEVTIQTTNKNFKLTFNAMLKANKFVTKIIDTLTQTTMAERGTTKIKNAINTVDDILGIDSRSALKSVVEKGIAGTLWKGIKKDK